MIRKRWLLAALPAAAALAAFALPAHAHAQGTSAFVTYNCGNQSTGLQAAENSVATGGTLYVAGTCSTGVTVQQGTTLEGTETGTTLDGPVIYDSTGPATIRNLTVSCGTAPACVDLENGFHVTVTGVTTSGGVNGIEVTAPACSVGCNVNDYFSHEFIKAHTGYGFYVNDLGNSITDGFFTDSWIQGGTDSIHLSNAAGWQVMNDHVYAESGLAVYARYLWGSQITGIDAEGGSMQLIAQNHSEPSTISLNRLDKGTITQTAAGTGGCLLTIIGNVTVSPISESGCTVAQAANLVGNR